MGVIRMLPNDADTVLAITELVDPNVAERTLVTLDGQDRVKTGARAIFTTVARTGGTIGFVSRLLAVKPVSLAMEPGYRLFAKHRGKLARFFQHGE